MLGFLSFLALVMMGLGFIIMRSNDKAVAKAERRQRLVYPDERAKKVGIVFQALRSDPMYQGKDEQYLIEEAEKLTTEHLRQDWWFEGLKAKSERRDSDDRRNDG